jgi:hypothetical protein
MRLREVIMMKLYFSELDYLYLKLKPAWRDDLDREFVKPFHKHLMTALWLITAHPQSRMSKLREKINSVEWRNYYMRADQRGSICFDMRLLWKIYAAFLERTSLHHIPEIVCSLNMIPVAQSKYHMVLKVCKRDGKLPARWIFNELKELDESDMRCLLLTVFKFLSNRGKTRLAELTDIDIDPYLDPRLLLY